MKVTDSTKENPQLELLAIGQLFDFDAERQNRRERVDRLQRSAFY
jgi:hypothetical protein